MKKLICLFVLLLSTQTFALTRVNLSECELADGTILICNDNAVEKEPTESPFVDVPYFTDAQNQDEVQDQSKTNSEENPKAFRADANEHSGIFYSTDEESSDNGDYQEHPSLRHKAH